MKGYAIYIKERFPVFPALLFSSGYALLAYGTYSSQINIKFFLLTSIFFFFLLKQRIIDEFRDYTHDSKNFPDRPVQRGLITKEQLMLLGIFAIIFELFPVILLGLDPLMFYLLILGYTYLMAKEFFLSHWLEKHFTTYFLLHEIIFLLFGLFFMIALKSSITGLEFQTIIYLAILTAFPMGIEVVRKFNPRFDKAGKAVADTYSTVWGRGHALSVLVGLSLIVGIGLVALKHSFIFLLFNLLSIIAWRVFGAKSDKAVTLIGVINFLGFALLANIL